MTAGTKPSPDAAGDSTVSPRLVLALFAADDLEALIDAAFDMLRAAAVCDFVSVFYRSGGHGLLKQRDSRGRESSPAFMRRYLELTPALPIALANRGVTMVRTRGILPSSPALRRTAFYREIMQVEGWRHAVALCFWGDPVAESPVLVASTYRREGRRDFQKQQIASLVRAHSFLDCAINRLNEREKARTMRDGWEWTARDATRGSAIVDSDLRLTQANLVARDLFAAWNQDSAEAGRSQAAVNVPPVLLAACRDLHHEWQRLLQSDPDVTGVRRHRDVRHPRIAGLTASITMMGPATAGIADPTFVLEIDRRLHGIEIETANRSIPVLRKLTPAERAVAIVVADGLSNQEIADQLGKTVHAVKFLLHRVYQKTGVPNRAALVAVLRSRPRRR